MSSKTKIVVLRLKEVIYTGIFVLLGIIVVVLLVTAFFPKNEEDTQPTNALADNAIVYVPGTYSTSLILNDMAANIEVIVDENYISSVRFVELNEAIKTKYPLLEPALNCRPTNRNTISGKHCLFRRYALYSHSTNQCHRICFRRSHHCT